MNASGPNLHEGSRWRSAAYVAGVVLVTAWFASRWRAAWYAYPFEGFTDERYLVDVAHAMVRDGDWNPYSADSHGRSRPNGERRFSGDLERER